MKQLIIMGILIILLVSQGCAFLKDFHNEIVNDEPPPLSSLPVTGTIYTPGGSYNYLVFPDGNIYIGD
jgi:hypothetical protein